jgi:hypothetical protein
MTFTRSFRQMVCRVLIGTLLFAQLAVAAYACPGLSAMASVLAASGVTAAPAPISDKGPNAVIATDEATTANDGMVMPCANLDEATPNLCAEHCRYGQQTADHAPAPMPAPALLSPLYALPDAAAVEGGAAPTLASASAALTAAAAPPLAILHCRWRI